MSNRKNSLTIIIISVTAVILIVSLSLGLTLPNIQLAGKNYLLFERAREILLQNFTATDFGDKAEKKRVIDNQNPMNLLNYYGDEPLTDLWASIPDNQKPYTIMLLVPGQILNAGNEKALNNLEKWADECEANSIPYAIQTINGESHMEARPPIAYLEERFANKHKWFYGLNAAELYNGVSWRGESESDNSLYIIEMIKLCAKYGAYFVWTDTNMNYENGMLLHWLENNESFYTTFKIYSDYICLLNKESIAHPSTYAVMEGLWLAGLIGNWGIASDWWHWQCDGDKKSLFGENDSYVDDEWEMIFSFPENMYVQSMMLGMSGGATCFKAEAPNFSTSYGGKPLAGFEYGISPLLNRIIDGSIKIASKDDVLAVTNYAVLGRNNYSKSNYDYEESNLYPKNGASGIMPLLPSNLRQEERKVFLDKGITLIDYKLSDEEFLRLYGSNDADTFLTYIATDWYYINNVENERKSKYANFSPKYASADNVFIKAEEHTSAIISEKNYGLDIFVSNYRTDKVNMYKNGTPQQRNEMGWAKFVSQYLSLDENGNPIGVSDTTLRQTVIKVQGTYNGGKPEVLFHNNADGSGANNRPFEFTENYDYESGILTLTINHNGIVDFTILLDEVDIGYTPVFKDKIDDSKMANTNLQLDSLIEATKLKNTEIHKYTYFSYMEYDKAFEKAIAAIDEKTYTQKDIDIIYKQLEEAKNNLIDVSRETELCLNVMSIQNRSNKQNRALDGMIRELLSSKKYINGRSNQLEYAKNYKKTNIESEIKLKPSYIEKRYKKLLKCVN